MPNKHVILDTEYKLIRKTEEIKDRSAVQLSTFPRVVLFIALYTSLDKTVFKLRLSADNLFLSDYLCLQLFISYPVAELPVGRESCLYKCFAVSKCSDFLAKSV